MVSPDDIPTVLDGRYELQRLLGRGGAGEVWAGTDARLGRPVAVKLVRIPPGLDGEDREETRRRVMREARAAARLKHPAAVTMYDVLDVDGQLCLVMELVEAPDLGRLVTDRGPLEPPEAAIIGLDVLGALEAAHARGLVHRDVKPSNVLVPASGPARLADFGTAVIVGEDRLTATGAVFGSPAYMAPEQAVDVEVGPAADLWSLGATLYHAVEGVPPFTGPTAIATMYAMMQTDPRPTERAGALGVVLDRLLVRDVEARATAEEIGPMLQAVREGGPVPIAGAPADPDPVPGLDGHVPVSDAEDGWGSSPALTRRRGVRRPALVGVAAAVLLLGATALAVVASQDDDAGVSVVAAEVSPVDLPATDEAATPTPTDVAPDEEVEATAPPGDVVPTELGATDEDGVEAGSDGSNSSNGSNDGDGPGEDDDGPGEDDDGPGQGQGNRPDVPPGQQEAAVAALPAATVPDDWTAWVPDDAPYTLAHPTDWTIDRLDATRTDITDPATATYLRLDWTDDPAPDALADWEAFEPQFAAGRQGYERIRMDPTTFKGEEAALWEYRYDSGSTTLRAYNLNVSGSQYGYALNFQTREDLWGVMEPLFGAFAQSYEIPR